VVVGVTGAGGFIGKVLVDNLREKNKFLHILSRKYSQYSPDSRYFFGDLSDNSEIDEAFLNDVDVLYHCAGEVNNFSQMRLVHVNGMYKLLKAVRLHIEKTQKPFHWVQLSSVGAYGPPAAPVRAVRLVTEESKNAPKGEYEVTKTMADDLLLEAAKLEPLLSYSILRPANVIGPAMTNQSLRALVKMIERRLFFYIGSKMAIANYIHVSDVVSALLLCGEERSAHNNIFNLSNDCLLSEVVDAVARAAGVNPPSFCVAEPLMRLLVKGLSSIRRGPLTQERIDALVKRTYYSSDKIKNILGYTHRYPIPESVVAMFVK
jgi:nucleoside-diphosphate-sugar epimerase